MRMPFSVAFSRIRCRLRCRIAAVSGSRVTPLLAVTLVLLPTTVQSQTSGSASAASLSLSEVRTLAEAHVAVSMVHDSSDLYAAKPRNKTVTAQRDLAAKKAATLAEVLKGKGLTDEQYRQQRFLVSTNSELRAQFDSIVAKLTGAPLPGRPAVTAAAPGTVPASALPAGPVGTHIGHVGTSFVDTPDKVGFLTIALTEAAVASQHATFAQRTPTDLPAMQLHAGHVIHALDPSLVASGPAKGFGVKRAAGGIAQHIELAAKESTASPNVKTHALHIATASRSVASRAEQAIAIAKQIQGATSAADAARLVTQLVSLCGQLVPGTDLNADGRITWGDGEGGLQQAQEHLTLLLAGERR
jgi:hypothetical protein